MTANDTIKTNIVIKSIQSLSMLKCSIACIWLRGREVTGSSHVYHLCIICHVLITYIDSFLQMKLCSDNLLHRQSRNSVAMTKGADQGSGTGVGKTGEGFKREGHGFETSQQQIFFLLLSLPITKRTKPLFFIYPQSPLRHLKVQKIPFIFTDRF